MASNNLKNYSVSSLHTFPAPNTIFLSQAFLLVKILEYFCCILLFKMLLWRYLGHRQFSPTSRCLNEWHVLTVPRGHAELVNICPSDPSTPQATISNHPNFSYEDLGYDYTAQKETLDENLENI